MKTRLFLWSLTAALAGFLFGFDTVVISGAEQTIQELWSLSPALHGLAMSMALWGTVAGSLIGSWPTDHFGRRKTLLWIGILYFVSAIWSAFATDPLSFMIARFIGGLGVGISTVAAPLFISEISPAKYRGRLAGMFQFIIVFGILIAFVSNALLGSIGENAWRWMLGVEAIPALIYSLMCFGLPESPRWLIGRKNDREGGKAVLRLIDPEASEETIEAKVQETLLELAGLPAKDNNDGQSLVPLLKDPTLEWKTPALMTEGPGNHAVRSDRWRYIRYADGAEELYDHTKDPWEHTKVAANSEYAKVIGKPAIQ